MNLSLQIKGFYDTTFKFPIEIGSPYHQTCNRTTEIVDWLFMRVFRQPIQSHSTKDPKKCNKVCYKSIKANHEPI
nr:MAG TPA: hypothetical protein [Caudoviricetes sp.]